MSKAFDVLCETIANRMNWEWNRIIREHPFMEANTLPEEEKVFYHTLIDGVITTTKIRKKDIKAGFLW
jgi:hypothetical protein